MRARSVPELGRCGIGSAEVQRVGCCWLQGRGKFGIMVAKMVYYSWVLSWSVFASLGAYFGR